MIRDSNSCPPAFLLRPTRKDSSQSSRARSETRFLRERNSPGGVIGKVVGGVRVEEVFTDGNSLESSDSAGATISLPVSYLDVEELRWGDDGKTLVGRSALGPGAPNMFYVFEINRPAGSLEVPLREISPGNQVIDLTLRQQVPFPFGLSVGTLQVNHEIEYEQHVLSFDSVTTQVWEQGKYVQSGSQHLNGQVTRVDDQVPYTVNRTYPLVLDLGSYDANGLYFWNILEDSGIYLTADGQILAMVEVWLQSLSESTTVPVYALRTTPQTNGNTPLTRVQIGDFSLSFDLPIDATAAPIRVLVDVTSGQIVASTAPQVIAISHQTPRTNLSSVPARPFETAITMFGKNIYVGGPRDGEFESKGEFFNFFSQDVITQNGVNCSAESLKQMTVFGQVTENSGTLNLAIMRYRPEFSPYLAAQVGTQSDFEIRAPFICGSRNGCPCLWIRS